MASMWKKGDLLRHRFNADVGPGRVTSVSGRRLEAFFPKTGATLAFAAESDAIVPFEIPIGATARLEASGETVEIASREGDAYRLSDGRRVGARDLWPIDAHDSP